MNSLITSTAPIGPAPTIKTADAVAALGRNRMPSGTLRNAIPEPTGSLAEQLAARRIQEHLDAQDRAAKRLAKLSGAPTKAPIIHAPHEDAAQFSGESLAPPPVVARADLETIQGRIKELNETGKWTGQKETGGGATVPGIERDEAPVVANDGDESEDESELDEPAAKPPAPPVKPAAKKAAKKTAANK